MITLKQEPVFSLCLNAQEFGGFLVTGEWQGFKKLERNGEYVIVATTKVRSPFSQAFNGIFNAFLLKGEAEEFFPVVATEGLAKLIAINLPTKTDAANDVLTERARQVSAEGYTTQGDDDRYKNGALATAAACYAAVAGGMALVNKVPGKWPFDSDSWKPTTPRRDLVKAGALILAEIERLDRAAAAAKGAQS